MKLRDTEQFRQGMDVEAFLDDYFTCAGYRVERLTVHEERDLCMGDRRFTKDGRSFLVEYKSGIQTYYTGNVFIETISVDTAQKPGWVYTCRAGTIVYAALLNGLILCFAPDRLRSKIGDLSSRFRTAKTSHGQNSGYATHGVLVPLDVACDELAIGRGDRAGAVSAALRLASTLAPDDLSDLAERLDDAEYEALARLRRPARESDVTA